MNCLLSDHNNIDNLVYCQYEQTGPRFVAKKIICTFPFDNIFPLLFYAFIVCCFVPDSFTVINANSDCHNYSVTAVRMLWFSLRKSQQLAEGGTCLVCCPNLCECGTECHDVSEVISVCVLVHAGMS